MPQLSPRSCLARFGASEEPQLHVQNIDGLSFASLRGWRSVPRPFRIQDAEALAGASLGRYLAALFSCF